MIKYTPQDENEDKLFEEFLTSNRITFTYVWNNKESMPEYIIHRKEHQTLIELKFPSEPNYNFQNGIEIDNPKRKFLYITPLK